MRISLLSAVLLILSQHAASAQFWDWGDGGSRYLTTGLWELD